MAAEGNHAAPTSFERGRFNGAAAGWPRKGVGHDLAINGKHQASMGPRPDGRGRIYPIFIGVVMMPLQWGRGRMAAEG